jgi:hypothetical protein
MIPDFPHSIKIRLAPLHCFLLRPETANRAETLHRQDATKNFLVGPILFLYYEESLVSSNLNSKLLWFHSVRPNVHAKIGIYLLLDMNQSKSHG